uniref:Uncharacterized protein n=1 Tax=Macrostomum lignano TaxID=282301 RepID=A0A1I8FBI4_9PLAT
MVEEYSPSPRLSQRGNSTVIELDIWLHRPAETLPAFHVPSLATRRFGAAGTSSRSWARLWSSLTAETSKPLTVPVDEDGMSGQTGECSPMDGAWHQRRPLATWYSGRGPGAQSKVSTLSAVTFDVVPQTMPLGQPDQLKDSGSFSPTKLAARGLK